MGTSQPPPGARISATVALAREPLICDYLSKPFSPRELLACIRTVLRRRCAEVRQGRPTGVRGYRFDGWELNARNEPGAAALHTH